MTFGLPLLFIGLFMQGPRKQDAEPPPSPSPQQGPSSPPKTVWAWKLLACIVIDLIGDGSLIVPGVGDASDFVWAPVSAVLVRLLFGNNVLAAVNFLEEILPFIDVIPTATIAFCIEYFFNRAEQEESVVQTQSRRRRMDTDVLDVKATDVRDDED